MSEQQEEIVEKKDRREGKGRVIALSRRVYRIINSDVYYIESESVDDMYYYVMWNTEKEFEWCSCPDYDKRHLKCKHIYGVEYAIRFGTVTDIDKLPEGAKKDNQVATTTKSKSCNPESLPYKSDQYGF